MSFLDNVLVPDGYSQFGRGVGPGAFLQIGLHFELLGLGLLEFWVTGHLHIVRIHVGDLVARRCFLVGTLAYILRHGVPKVCRFLRSQFLSQELDDGFDVGGFASFLGSYNSDVEFEGQAEVNDCVCVGDFVDEEGEDVLEVPVDLGDSFLDELGVLVKQ